jgi:hypothetical protein
LKREVNEDPAGTERRRRAARERAARERLERVAKAMKHVREVEEKKKTDEKKKKARASTTDPEVRVMKMADGGFRPAFNGQFAADTETMVILGVDLDNGGSDQGKMSPMVEQLQERCGKVPSEYLVDGGFANHRDIEKVSGTEMGSTVYAPVQEPKNKNRDRFQPMASDTESVAEWRKRMGTEAAKKIYKERAATAECVNAQARNRGLQQFSVRGMKKAKAVLLWFALAHNLMRTVALRLEFAKVAI